MAMYAVSAMCGRRIDATSRGSIILVGFAVLLGLFTGLRPYDLNPDTPLYTQVLMFAHEGVGNFLKSDAVTSEPLFKLIFGVLGMLPSPRMALVIISLACCGGIAACAAAFSPDRRASVQLAMFAFMMATFSFFNLSTNIIRNGLSMPLFLLAVYYLYKEQPWRVAIFSVLSLLLHYSSAMFMGVALVAWIARNVKLRYFVIALGVVLALAAAGISVVDIPTERFGLPGIYDVIHYYKMDLEYKVGFRPDFAAYNTLLLAAFLILRRYTKSGHELADFLLRTYVLMSCLFFMWFSLLYSDRVGTYSWVLTGILLFYYTRTLRLQWRIAAFVTFVALNGAILLK